MTPPGVRKGAIPLRQGRDHETVKGRLNGQSLDGAGRSTISGARIDPPTTASMQPASHVWCTRWCHDDENFPGRVPQGDLASYNALRVSGECGSRALDDVGGFVAVTLGVAVGLRRVRRRGLGHVVLKVPLTAAPATALPVESSTLNGQEAVCSPERFVLTGHD